MRLRLMTASFLLVVVSTTMLPAADGHPDAVGVPVFAFGDQPGALPGMISTPASQQAVPPHMREWLHETSQRKGIRVQDDVVLAMQKSGDDLLLSWTGQSGSVSVLRADEPQFSRMVTTLEDGFLSATLAVPVAESAATITYFEVSDSETASRAEAGLGYEPRPAPRVGGAETRQGLPWWGSTISMTGSYFAAIEGSNLTFMHDRPVRASSVSGIVSGTSPGREYATQATFDIPGDARGGFITVQADGPEVSKNEPYLPLVMPGIQYSSIWGVSWAPTTGKIWVAAENQIDQVDLFRFDPIRTTMVSGGTQPRISRPTLGGQILFIDAFLGVPAVQQIDVATGSVSVYAITQDAEFTRPIHPAGIAVEPDGSACYIADASEGKIVRIPIGNSSPIEDEWGGKTDWSFAHPCGMDASPNSAVYVADASGAIFSATASGTLLHSNQSYVVKAIHVVRDISTDGVNRFFFTAEPGFSEAFNLNPIGYGWNGSTVAGDVPARYLGGFVYGHSDGWLLLTNEDLIEFEYHKPEAVLVSNTDASFPYLSDRQGADRVIEFSVDQPWSSFPVPFHLRLIDPPDLAPYDDKDLDDPTGFATFPYEADDNHVSIDDCVSAGECGLSVNPDGSGATRELIAAPPGLYYLKIPVNASGENFLIQVSKADPATSALIPNRVLTLGPVFTSWKRVFVERDKMFRKGGLLARDFDPNTCGTGGVEPACDEVIVFDWADVSVGDEIVLFQSDRSIDSSSSLSAVVTQVSAAGQPYSNSRRVALDTVLGDIGLVWEASSDQPATVGGTASVVFATGKSAGIGVLSGCDSDPNQINGSNSCFFQGDLRGGRASYGDAFIELRGHRNGADGVPYLPPSWVVTASPQDFSDFSSVWFQNPGDNKIQLIGASKDQEDNNVSLYGWTDIDGNYSYVFRESCEARGLVEGKTSAEIDSFTRDTTIHEFAHQWEVNCCAPSGHDTRDAWCINEPFCADEGCIMHGGFNPFNWDDVVRFCVEDLLLGDPLCGTGSFKSNQTDQCPIEESALRTATDPI